MSHPSSSQRFTALLLGTALALVPLGMWVEDTASLVWQNRLFGPDYQSDPNRHTPLFTEGTYLPPTIDSAVTYTRADSPLILTRTTHIPSTTLVTIEPGVIVVAHEFAAFTVDGTLSITGTTDQPVTFTTNEIHPDNKNWGGIIVQPGGSAILRHTLIEYASPALACLPTSRLTGEYVQTRFGLVGLYTESAACTLTTSRLQAVQYGVIAIGVSPSPTNVNISAGIASVKEVEKIEI